MRSDISKINYLIASNPLSKKTAHILCRLGITANYIGFCYTTYAVILVAEDPTRLQLVTKWLYPDVAAKFNTGTDNVRKAIDKVCSLAWEKNPEFLSEIADFKLKKKPGTCEFLAVLAVYVSLIYNNQLIP